MDIMKIPEQYKNPDDGQYGIYRTQIQMERWIEDLLAQIEDLNKQIQEPGTY